MRLIDRAAALVADDITIIAAADGRLRATCPTTIAGRMEVRGIGIVTVAALPAVDIALCVALDEPPERLPPDPLPIAVFEGLEVPKLALVGFESSAPLKVEQALRIYGLAS